MRTGPPVRVRGSKGTEMKLRCKISTVRGSLSIDGDPVDTATNRLGSNEPGSRILEYGEIDALRVKGCPSVNT